MIIDKCLCGMILGEVRDVCTGAMAQSCLYVCLWVLFLCDIFEGAMPVWYVCGCCPFMTCLWVLSLYDMFVGAIPL